jgi:hypothetical protein
VGFLREKLPEDLHYWLEPTQALEFEVRAADALERKEYLELITTYAQSRAFPRAVQAIYSEFTSGSFSNVMEGGQALNWEPEPRREDGEEQGTFTYLDWRTKNFIVRSVDQKQTIVRTLDRADEGYSISLKGDASLWTVELNEELRLEWIDGQLRFMQGEKRLGSVEASPTFITMIPIGNQILIYLADRFTFITLANLGKKIRIGVLRGIVRISAIRTHDQFTED